MAFGDTVQSASNSASGVAAIDVTFGSALTPGNLIVLLHMTGDGAGGPGSGMSVGVSMTDGGNSQVGTIGYRVVQSGDGLTWGMISDLNDTHVLLGLEIEGPFGADALAAAAQNGGNPLASTSPIDSGSTGTSPRTGFGVVIATANGSGFTATYSDSFVDAGNVTLASALTVMGATKVVAASNVANATITFNSAPGAAMGGVVLFQEALRLEQEGSRARNDDGTEATATWKAAQDTDLYNASNLALRLRVLLNATATPGTVRIGLGYKVNGGQLREVH